MAVCLISSLITKVKYTLLLIFYVYNVYLSVLYLLTLVVIEETMSTRPAGRGHIFAIFIA